MVREHKLTRHNLIVKILVVLTSVGEATAEKCEQQYAGRIDVGWWAAELSFLHNFGCHVGGSSTEEFYFLCVWNLGAEPEVN